LEGSATNRVLPAFPIFSKAGYLEAIYFGSSMVITGPASAAGSSTRRLVASLASSAETDSDEEEPQPTSMSTTTNDSRLIGYISNPFNKA
jgi:hypothetical protein